MTETPAIKHEDIGRFASRVMWAGGLLFTLLLLMGLSGVASITLMHEDEQYFKAMKGVEGAVARTVLDLKWLIRAIHQFGGYIAMLLAFWAGAEIFHFGRVLKRTDDAGWRAKGRHLPLLGAAGSLILVVSLGALVVSGYMAGDYLGQQPAIVEELELSDRFGGDGQSDEVQLDTRPAVEWHTRELNFAMALGAILLVLGVSSVRNVALEVKQARREDQASGSSQK